MSKEKWEETYDRYASGELDKKIEMLDEEIAKVPEIETNKENGTFQLGDTRQYVNGEPQKVSKNVEYVVKRSAGVNGEVKDGKLTNEQRKQARLNQNPERKEKIEAEKKRLTKIKENFPKIENVLKYREILQKRLDEIKNEISYRQKLEAASTKSQELDEEYKELTLQKEKAKEELKNIPENETERREEVKKRIKEINQKQDNNQLEFSKTQEILINNSTRRAPLSNKTSHELNSKMLETGSMISKCNFACRLMMAGRSSNDISINNSKDSILIRKIADGGYNRETINEARDEFARLNNEGKSNDNQNKHGSARANDAGQKNANTEKTGEGTEKGDNVGTENANTARAGEGNPISVDELDDEEKTGEGTEKGDNVGTENANTAGAGEGNPISVDELDDEEKTGEGTEKGDGTGTENADTEKTEEHIKEIEKARNSFFEKNQDIMDKIVEISNNLKSLHKEMNDIKKYGSGRNVTDIEEEIKKNEEEMNKYAAQIGNEYKTIKQMEEESGIETEVPGLWKVNVNLEKGKEKNGVTFYIDDGKNIVPMTAYRHKTSRRDEQAKKKVLRNMGIKISRAQMKKLDPKIIYAIGDMVRDNYPREKRKTVFKNLITSYQESLTDDSKMPKASIAYEGDSKEIAKRTVKTTKRYMRIAQKYGGKIPEGIDVRTFWKKIKDSLTRPQLEAGQGNEMQENGTEGRDNGDGQYEEIENAFRESIKVSDEHGKEGQGDNGQSEVDQNEQGKEGQGKDEQGDDESR